MNRKARKRLQQALYQDAKEHEKYANEARKRWNARFHNNKTNKKTKYRQQLTYSFKDRYEAEEYLKDNIERMLDFFKNKNVKTVNQLRYDMFSYYLQKTFVAKENFRVHRDFPVISKVYKAKYWKWREKYWNVVTAIDIVDLLKIRKDEEINPLLHNTNLTDKENMAFLVDLQIKKERNDNKKLEKAGKISGYSHLYDNCKKTNEISKENE